MSSAPPSAPTGSGDDDWKVQRDAHKAKADASFRFGGYRTAIDEYTNAITLDPDFVVAYSNRSAAYLKNNEISKALQDANRIIELDPAFVKGYSRLAAALHALRRYRPAKEAYQKVLDKDPNNAVAKKGLEDCQKTLDHIEEQQKRAFEVEEKERMGDKAPTSTSANDKAADDSKDNDVDTDENKESKEDDDDDGDEEDDLLADFFDDVEDVTTKKKADDSNEDAAKKEQPKATNAIKNQKQAIGTYQEQVDRLLQNNYEWKNLNPFAVLQLTKDATDDDISHRYKAMALLLHPDKNGGSEQAQKSYDEVKKAKNTLMDINRRKHAILLIEEGMKMGEDAHKRHKSSSLQECQEKEIMRIFAQVEMKRREVEQRERKFEQREKQQEDEQLEVERKARKFDKSWKQDDRVKKRIGNWRDFASNKKRK